MPAKLRCQKAVIRKLIRQHQRNLRLGKNVEVLIWLDFLMFMKRLAAECDVKAHEDKSKVLKEYHVAQVVKNVLKSCKG